jgi:hypothetical protein
VAIANYTYSNNAVGLTAPITNAAMGAMPTFTFTYINNQYGNNVWLKFYKGIMKKITLPGKNTEFDMFDIEFSCFSDQNGNVFTLSLDE